MKNNSQKISSTSYEVKSPLDSNKENISANFQLPLTDSIAMKKTSIHTLPSRLLIAALACAALLASHAPASANGGLSFTNYTTDNGLGNNNLYGVYASGSSIYAATEGGLSISTDASGPFTNYTTGNGLGNNYVFGVYASGSSIYAATFGGGLSISTNNGTTFTNRTTGNGLGSNQLRGVYASGSSIYAATRGGLSISTDGGGTFINSTTGNGLVSNLLNGVYASGSSIYAATDFGLSISTDGGATFTNYTTSNGLGANNVRGVYASGSSIYAATFGGGLSISTDGGLTFGNRTTADGLGSNNLSGVYASGSSIYAATTSGLSISTDGGATFTNYTMADGLVANDVKGVYASGSSIYAATWGGLSIGAVPTTTLYWLGSAGDSWTAANNWSSNATGTPTGNFTASSDIVFSADNSSNETATNLGGDQTISSLTINTTAPVGISGGNLTVSGATAINTGTLTIGNGGTTGALIGDITNNATLAFNRSNNSTYSGTIDGTGNVNKLGNGTLTLNASNTYTGATMLSAGTLALGNADALSGSTLNHSNNATLRFSLPGANTYNIGGLAGDSSSSSISIGNNTLSIGANNESTAFSGAVYGTGSIIKSGTGALTLSGSSTYNGTTSLNAGTLQIGSASGLGSGGNITFGGGTLQYGNGITADVSSRIQNSGSAMAIDTNGNTVTYSSSINATNSGGLTKLGNGTLSLNGNNSYTGGTVIESGTLTGNNLGLKGEITNNATLLLTNGSSYQTEISGTGNLLVANSATLLGNATMSGGTTIQSGTLTIGGRDSTQTFILGSIDGDITNEGALRFDMNTGNRTYSGVISGNGSLVSTSSASSPNGILYLRGNNTFTGGTTFSHGTLDISGGTLASSGNLTILGGSFDIGASNQTIGNFKINGFQTTAARGSGILTASNYDLQQGTVSFSLNGTAGLAKNSVGYGSDSYQNGVVHLSGNNTATGNITVSSGILSFNTVQSLYSGNNASWTPDKISVSANSTLALGTGDGSATSGFSDAQIFEIFSSLTQNSTGTLTPTTGLTAGSSIGFNVASGNFTLNSTISDRLDLGVIGMDKIGAGALVLGSSNTFTGPINIYEGTIRAGTDYALSNSTSLVVSLKDNTRPATYDIGDFNQQFVDVTLLGGILNGGNGTITATGNYSMVSGNSFANLAGVAPLLKTGSGIAYLYGNSTYLGHTTINGTYWSRPSASDARLQFQNPVALYTDDVSKWNGGNITVNQYGIFSVRADDTGAQGFTEDRIATLITNLISANRTSGGFLAGSAFGIDTAGTNMTLSTALTDSTGQVPGGGAIGFIKYGTGTLTLNGTNNTHSLVTSVTGGTLALAPGTTLSAANATISVQNASLDLGTTSQTVAQVGVSNGFILGSGTLTANAGNYSFYSANITANLAGPVGANIENYSGTTTLAGNNTHSGNTNVGVSATVSLANLNAVVASTLVTDSGSATLFAVVGANTYNLGGLQGLGNIAFGNNTLSIGANNQSTSYGSTAGSLSGTGSVIKVGNGTLTFEGNNTYSGGTTISAGTLALGNNTTGGSVTGNITNDANLIINRSGNFTFANVVSGSGNVTQVSSGRLIVSGANTYTGNTSVNAGTLDLTGSLESSSIGIASGAALLNQNGGLSANTAVANSGNFTVNAADTIGSLSGSGNTILNAALTTGSLGTADVISGSITGTASLTKEGTGTLSINGSATNSGGLVISNGTLSIGNGGTSGSITGDITNSAALVFNRSNAYTYSGIVSGGGSLEQLGTGTTILDGNNTYSGGTIVTAGTLQGTTQSLQGAITNNATLVFNQTANGTYSGDIAGTGLLTKNGTGTITFSGTSSFSGNASINTGTLAVTGSLANAATQINSGATLTGNGTLGAVTINSGGTIAPGTITVGNMTWNSGGTYAWELGNVTSTAGTGWDLISSAGTLTIGANATNQFIIAASTNSSSSGFDPSVRSTSWKIADFAGGILGFSADAFSINTTGFGTLPSVYAFLVTADSNALYMNYGTIATWSGGTGNWTDTSNWVNGFPAANGLAVEYAGTNGTSTNNSGTNSIESLTFTNNATGAFTLAGGGLTIGAGGIVNDSAYTNTIAMNLALGANQTFAANTANLVVSGNISGAASLTKAGNQTLTLEGSNTYTGTTTVNNGTLEVATGGSINNTADIFVGILNGDNGTFHLNGGSVSNAGGYLGAQVGSVGAASVSAGNWTNTGSLFVGVGGTGSLTINGTGNVTNSDGYIGHFSGSNGTVGVSGGTWTNNTNLFIGNEGTGSLTISGTGNVTNSDGYIGNLAGGNGTVSVSGGTWTNSSNLFVGVSGTGSLTINGTGTVIVGDTLSRGSNGTINLESGGTLQIGTGGATGTLATDLANDGTLIFNLTGSSEDTHAISGTGTLTKNGTGTLILSGSNTYTGSTTLNAGTLEVNSTFENTATTVNSGGTLAGVGSLGDVSINSGGAIAPGNSAGMISVGNLTLNGGAIYNWQTSSGNGTGTAGTDWDLISSAGSLTLNTSSANITINLSLLGTTLEGVKKASWDIGNFTAGITGFNKNAFSFDAFSMNGSDGRYFMSLGVGNTTLVLNYKTAATWITGNGNWTTPSQWEDDSLPENGDAVEFTGAGGTSTNNFASANLSTVSGFNFLEGAGAYTVNGNTLQIGQDGIVNSSNQTQTIAMDVTSDGLLTVNAASGNLVLSGVFSGNWQHNLEKTGNATLTLTGNNIYEGGTIISAGTLQIGNGGTTGSVIGDIANVGALVFNRADSTTFTGNITGTGGVNQVGTGTLVLTADSTYTGNTTISSGTLQLGNGGTSGSLAGAILNNATLAINRSDDLTFANALTGTGSVLKLGNNTLTYTSTSPQGGTTVNAGTLLVTGTTTSVTVNNSGTLAGTGTIGDVTINSGGAIAPGNSPGTISVGNLTLSGGAIYNWQTLSLNGTGIAGTDWDLITSSGSLSINASANSTVGIRVSTLNGNFTSNIKKAQWQIGNFTSGITVYDQSYFSVNASGTGSRGRFFVTTNNTSLLLNYKTAAVWIGGNGSWTTANLWEDAYPPENGDAVEFSGSGGTSTNNSSLTSIAGLTFTSSATGSYTLNGNALAIGEEGIVNDSAFDHAIALNLTGGVVFGVNAATNNLTLSGVVSGNSALLKNGNSTLTLTGINIYTGGTTVSAGALVGTTQSLQGAIANNAALNFNQSFSGTYAGAMSGTGSLTKTGSGVVLLSGNNTYSGGTTINSGTLKAALSGNLVTLNPNAFGTGGVNINAGGAMLVPSTTPDGSHLSIGGDLTLNNGTIAFYDIGTSPAGQDLRIDVSGNFTNAGSGAVFDFSQVEALDAGNYTLVSYTFTNFATSAISSRAGVGTTLQGSFSMNGSSLVYTVLGAQSSGTDIQNNGGPNTPIVSNYTINQTGVVTIGANNTVEALTFNSDGSLNIQQDGVLNVTSGTLNVEDGSSVVSGGTLLAPAGFNKDGGGELDFTNNMVVTGAAAVNEGLLSVNGNLTFSGGSGNITVGGNGTLGGNGSIAGNVLFAGGNLAPGNSPGNLTIGGNLVLTGANSTIIEIASPTNFDRITVTGQATLAGNMSVVQFGGYQLAYGQRYDILTAVGGITGEFANINMPVEFENSRGRFLISGTTGTLLIAPLSYVPLALNQNQRNVAAALDTFIAATSGDQQTVSIALDSLTTGEYPSAFNQIMPGFYESLASVSIEQAFNQTQMLNQRIGSVRLGASGFQAMGGITQPLMYDKDGKSAAAAKDASPIVESAMATNWNTWALGNGQFSRTTNLSNLQNSSTEAGGFLVGADYRWSENLVSGLYAGYEYTYSKYGSDSNMRGNGVNFGGYASYATEEGYYADAVIGGGYTGYQTRRSIKFSTIDRTAKADPNSTHFSAALNLGKDFEVGKFTLGPIVGAQYTYAGIGSFTESGADSLDLELDQQNANSLRSTLGGRIAYTWNLNQKIAIIPEVRMFWQHEFLNNARNINASLDGGNGAAFDFKTTDPYRSSVFAGAGVTAQFGKNLSGSVFYNVNFGSQTYQSGMVSVGLNVAF